MLAYALALLSYLRATQKYDATRRVLCVIHCITWMEACLRRWPEHTSTLRAVAVLAAEGDLMGSQLDGVWAMVVPLCGCWALYFVPYCFVMYGQDVGLSFILYRLTALFAACGGYGASLAADTQCGCVAAALVEAVGVFCLATLLGLD